MIAPFQRPRAVRRPSTSSYDRGIRYTQKEMNEVRFSDDDLIAAAHAIAQDRGIQLDTRCLPEPCNIPVRTLPAHNELLSTIF